MSVHPYRPNEFTREGQAYMSLQETLDKARERIARLEQQVYESFKDGVKAAAAFAGERFDSECSSKYQIEDVVLAKLNLLDNDKIRLKRKKTKVVKKRKSSKRKK